MRKGAESARGVQGRRFTRPGESIASSSASPPGSCCSRFPETCLVLLGPPHKAWLGLLPRPRSGEGAPPGTGPFVPGASSPSGDTSLYSHRTLLYLPAHLPHIECLTKPPPESGHISSFPLSSALYESRVSVNPLHVERNKSSGVDEVACVHFCDKKKLWGSTT